MEPFSPKHRLWLSVGILGFAALTSQMLFMRGLLAAFYGTELSLGVLFAVWLLWTAAGSGLLPMFLPVHAHDWGRLRVTLLLLALSIPLTDWFIRQSRIWLHAAPGEIMFAGMGLTGFVVFALFCLLSGYAYAVACRMIPSSAGEKSVSSAPVLFKGAVGIYAVESFGAAAGGLSASLLLFPLASQVQIVVFLSGLLIIAGLVLPSGIRRPSGRRSSDLRSLDRKSLYYILAVLLLAVVFIFTLAPAVQTRLDRYFWKTGRLMVSKNTAYGHVAFARMDGQTSVFENGQLLFTCPDLMSAEAAVHFALLEHPSPEKILLIGGSLGGAVEQAFQHPSVKTVHAVELDPEIIRLARKCLPPADRAFLDDPRVKLHLTDARRFISQTDEKYDAILLDMPNPYTLQLNRFYTLEFFRAIQTRLNRGGIFSLQLPSSENAIGKQLSDLLSTVRATLSAVFPGMVLLPGNTCFFIASMDGRYLTANPDTLDARMRERRLKTVYLREYYLKYDLSKERSTYLSSKLHPVAAERLNRDFRPLATWYDLIFWSKKFGDRYAGRFRLIISGFRMPVIQCIFILALLAVSVLIGVRRNRRARFGVGLCIAAAGFSGISLELIFLTAYQTRCGVLYQDMAIIVAGYMAGLGMGSLASMKSGSSPSTLGRLMRLQFLIVAFPVVSAGVLSLLQNAPLLNRFSGLNMLLFAGLNILTGLIAGTAFGLANRLMLSGAFPSRNTAGGLYALDLAGSVAGVLLYTALVIPLLGIQASLWGISLINLAVFLVLWISGKHMNS
jgi:spermidine synthase